MKRELEIGTLMSGQKFCLPLELVTRTLACIGIRGSGKTVAATVIAEEMCEAGLPWVALDPVGVWWGLRVNPDGSPGGYPVVVLGGEHADLPLEKTMGPRIAEAILQENVSCVVDLSGESKNVWRYFVTEFCDRLMELRPAVPRHIFIEEAPEFVPQKPMGEQKRSLAAVDRLIRLGRNRGYGATLISQRFATIQKDVLTQCESLLALRSIGKPDRNAARDWIAEVVAFDGTKAERKAEEFLESLAKLESGTGWFWSPQWLDLFVNVRIRHRKTYHPGETRTVGQAPKQVALSDVRDFVDRFEEVLAKPVAAAPQAAKRQRHRPDVSGRGGPDEPAIAPAVMAPNPAEIALRQENQQLRASMADIHRQLGAAKSALDAVRKVMEPEYRAMQKLFAELDAAAPAGGAADPSVFEPWKEKLGKGARSMLEVLLQRGPELNRNQLSTLSGISISSSYFRDSISALNRNGLIEKDGDKIRLRIP